MFRAQLATPLLRLLLSSSLLLVPLGCGSTDTSGGATDLEQGRSDTGSGASGQDDPGPGPNDGEGAGTTTGSGGAGAGTSTGGGAVGGGSSSGGGGGGAGPSGGGGSGDFDDCFQCVLLDCNLPCALVGSCPGDWLDVIEECVLVTCGDECLGWTPPPCDGGGPCDCDLGPGCDGCWCEPVDECGGADLGDCCEGSGSHVGCEDPAVEQCVCGSDAYCCDVAWDAQCTAEVAACGLGACP